MSTTQVTEETCNILRNFGYSFEQRGMVSVKGKGQLMTYYLTGKGGNTDQSLTPQGAQGAQGGAASPSGHWGSSSMLALPGGAEPGSLSPATPEPRHSLSPGALSPGALSGGLSPAGAPAQDDEDDGDPAESAKLLEGVRISMPEESSPAAVRPPSETSRLLDQ